MQYDLGTHQSMYVHAPAQLPTSGNDLVGGFRVLPSPQSDFGWPSPPNLDFNPYTVAERSVGADSTVIYLESRVEDTEDSRYMKHQGLQFKRTVTLYKASTRVKVEMTMLNKGPDSLTHGIWDITQSACGSSDVWVYFPRNPASTLGGGRGYVQYMNEGSDSTQWKPDAAEGGIMGVQYLKKVGKVGADCRAGWICFNDRKNGYAYVKAFDYQEGKTYPDSGAAVQVYTYSDYDMLEVEVLAPLTVLGTNDSVTFTENWYAARSHGPVLAVNGAGLVTKRLRADQPQPSDSVGLTGVFGQFFPGKVRIQFTDSSGAEVLTADSVPVLPADSLVLAKKYQAAPGGAFIRLALFDNAGQFRGILDSVAVPHPAPGVGTAGQRKHGTYGRSISLSRAGRFLRAGSRQPGSLTVELLSIDGKLLSRSSAENAYTCSVTLPGNCGQLCIVRINAGGVVEHRKICLAGDR